MYGLLAGSALVAAASARAIAPRQTGLSADLSLAGPACNTYGKDIENLRLTVSYDTSTLLEVNNFNPGY
jgi:alpha-glucosidase